MSKKLVFLTGTRADFGKLKSLIEITQNDPNYQSHIFVTGMHLHMKWGYTVDEIVKCGYSNIYSYINYTSEESMDLTLAKTIEGFSNYIDEIKPDMIIIHGDRVEALAGAIVGALNNILVAHIEGGEVSGTIDELIRHSISKMSHIHFVANEEAERRLIQMGEEKQSIFVIGSPDVDMMFSSKLPSIEEARERYEIEFDPYGLVMFHPVTTEIEQMAEYSKNLVDSIIESGRDYVVICPNNDLGSSYIFESYEKLENLPNIRMFPSIRFEYFLVLLKNAEFVIGNSSAGIREAPYYGIPVVNIGSRQQNRNNHPDIINCGYASQDILTAIHSAIRMEVDPVNLFGYGNSDKLFMDILNSDKVWKISKQKLFNDLGQ